MDIYTHNNESVSLIFTKNHNVKHRTQKQHKPNIVGTRHYNSAYITIMAVLIIFPVVLHLVVSLILLAICGQGKKLD